MHTSCTFRRYWLVLYLFRLHLRPSCHFRTSCQLRTSCIICCLLHWLILNLNPRLLVSRSSSRHCTSIFWDIERSVLNEVEKLLDSGLQQLASDVGQQQRQAILHNAVSAHLLPILQSAPAVSCMNLHRIAVESLQISGRDEVSWTAHMHELSNCG